MGPGLPTGPVIGPGVGPGAPGGGGDELDLNNVSPEFKKEGGDWFAVFNSKTKKVLDVSLMHTLMHER